MDFSFNRSFVMILLIQYIACYRVSKVKRKHTKLDHNYQNCFTNDTYYVAPKSTMDTLN